MDDAVSCLTPNFGKEKKKPKKSEGFQYIGRRQDDLTADLLKYNANGFSRFQSLLFKLKFCFNNWTNLDLQNFEGFIKNLEDECKHVIKRYFYES